MAQLEGFMRGEELVKEPQTLVTHLAQSMEKALLWCVYGGGVYRF